MCGVLNTFLISVVSFQKYYVSFKVLANYGGPQLIFNLYLNIK